MNDKERLYRAEVQFDELVQGGRELITSASEPSFEFYDGEVVKGYGDAANKAEKAVQVVRATINRP